MFPPVTRRKRGELSVDSDVSLQRSQRRLATQLAATDAATGHSAPSGVSSSRRSGRRGRRRSRRRASAAGPAPLNLLEPHPRRCKTPFERWGRMHEDIMAPPEGPSGPRTFSDRTSDERPACARRRCRHNSATASEQARATPGPAKQSGRSVGGTRSQWPSGEEHAGPPGRKEVGDGRPDTSGTHGLPTGAKRRSRMCESAGLRAVERSRGPMAGAAAVAAARLTGRRVLRSAVKKTRPVSATMGVLCRYLWYQAPASGRHHGIEHEARSMRPCQRPPSSADEPTSSSMLFPCPSGIIISVTLPPPRGVLFYFSRPPPPASQKVTISHPRPGPLSIICCCR